MKVYIGRPSALGNPFVIGKDGTREEVITKYRQWFENKLDQDDYHVVEEIGRLYPIIEEEGGLELECWCAPLPCHGDVIRQHLIDRFQVWGVDVSDRIKVVSKRKS